MSSDPIWTVGYVIFAEGLYLSDVLVKDISVVDFKDKGDVLVLTILTPIHGIRGLVLLVMTLRSIYIHFSSSFLEAVHLDIKEVFIFNDSAEEASDVIQYVLGTLSDDTLTFFILEVESNLIFKQIILVIEDFIDSLIW